MPDPDMIPQPTLRPSDDEIRARQKSRSLVMALILGALVVLFFVITIVKIRAGHA